MNKILYVDDYGHPGVINMAIDDLLGKREILSDYDFILRTYFWHKSTLSCGYHQKPEKRINFDGCKLHNVEVVRRPTGGRELLHDGDMSFSITGKLRDSSGKAEVGAKDYFVKAAGVIVGGLREIGINAEVTSGNKKSAEHGSAPCLAAISQYEIVCEGRKIVPMAQRVYPEAVMVHGSIPIIRSKIPTAELIVNGKNSRLQKIIEESSTDLERELESEFDLERLKFGIKRVFEGNFSGKAEIAGISDRVLELANNEKAKWKIQ